MPDADETTSAPKSGTARLVDATAMKAFAHPLRMAMYDYLNDHGSATATMLAAHLGESTGQTSYHLRQLERHGFVTDDLTRGKGRERWWKALGFTLEGFDLVKDHSTRPAVLSTLRHQVNQRAENLQNWYMRSETESEEWVSASVNSRYSLLLTPDETAEMKKEIFDAMDRFVEKSKQRAETGAAAESHQRRVRVYLDIFPLSED